MASSKVRPHLVVADENGDILDHPELLMVCRRGNEIIMPRPDELIPLPEESELFLLPGRHALGLDPETGQLEEQEYLAVAAFASPGHTLAAHPAYISGPDAPELPLFAYGAIGFANDRFYIAAKKVDEDKRQQFAGISRSALEKKAHAMMRRFPENRLIQHIGLTCALTYSCPAARNLCLGRYEAPLPVSNACNARCVGCISLKEETSPGCSTPQSRMTFTPTVREIVEVMEYHASNERERPIFSFGQGCEGEPLTQAALMEEAIREYLKKGGKGTINLNTNASIPSALTNLAGAGLTSMRVSLNSARDEAYARYYRPQGYSMDNVRESIVRARQGNVFVSLNLLYFPGFTDTEEETRAIISLVNECGVNFIQLRNLNIDPEKYLKLMAGIETGPCIGLNVFRKRLVRECPGLKLGYFNPYVESGFSRTAD